MNACDGGPARLPRPRQLAPLPFRLPLAQRLVPHRLLLALILFGFLAACGTGEGAPGTETSSEADAAPLVAADAPGDSNGLIRPGIDVLLTDSLHLVEGRVVGLITNQTGIDREGVPSIDRLHDHPTVELASLFSPEHGIRGTAEAGELVDHTVDEATGLPIHSLYGDTRQPTPQMLEGLDVLLFDIQDIGTRYYTYIYTLALAMEAAGAAGLPVIVLDRPNAIGGQLVQGNVLDPEYSSFVGLYPIPMRHGLTPGELALLYRDHFGVEATVGVVPVAGWSRDVLFPDTGLPWVAPSPNMPSVESALHYPGTCLFEGTNLSVGRGTDRAFQQIGAPWIDGEELARRMGARSLEGVRFEAVRFRPQAPGDGKFADQEVGGVRLHVTDPELYDPSLVGVALLVETRRMGGANWAWNVSHFDRLVGTSDLRRGIEAGLDVGDLVRDWPSQLEAFEHLARDIRIYR